MISTYAEAKALANKWDKLKTDKERIQFVLDHKEHVKVMLDNDMTFIDFIINPDKKIDKISLIEDLVSELRTFDSYLGCTDLVQEWLTVTGIQNEEV